MTPKPLLVLDLDETLVFATTQLLMQEPDYNSLAYAVYKRPGVDEFLKAVSEHYLLAVWSSGGKFYVEPTVQQLLPEGIQLEFVWSGDRCTKFLDPEWRTTRDLKDLKKVKRKGYNLNRMLIVENSPYKCKRNYGNAIFIKDFEGDAEDRELELLTKYLLLIKDHPNYRDLDKRAWRDLAQRAGLREGPLT